MSQRKVPHSGFPEHERIQSDRIEYKLWYCLHFPIELLGGRLDKDPQEIPWILGLLDDIEQEGRLRNPVIIWNHHPHRLTGKQPKWLLRAGSNRVWCAEQLGWTSIPGVVSTVWSERPPTYVEARPILPGDLQSAFPDGGKLWANEHGFGLLAAKKPEQTYADFKPSVDLELRTINHGRTKIINPLTDN